MKKAIIYLHGFNSASLDLSGKLLTSKQKLLVLNQWCQQHQVKFCSPNVDYRNFNKVISDITRLYLDFKSEGYSVIFMGSSLGGFSSDYLAMKNHSKAIMINPAISPSELLSQFIGVSENFEIKQDFDWTEKHCEQYKHYENELNEFSVEPMNRTIFLDLADELIDSSKTVEKYSGIAKLVTFAGGSHGFEHIAEALPTIKAVVLGE